MLYAGIDLHKRTAHVVVSGEKGIKVAEQNLACEPEAMVSFFSQFNEPVSSVIEATANWPWLVKLLREKEVEVCLAHPMKVKAIASAKIKNDKIDATILSHLLRSDLVPTSYIPSEDEQRRRIILRFRHRLVTQRTEVKNTITSLIGKENLKSPVSDLFGKKGRIWLLAVLPSLSVTQQMVVNESLDLLDGLGRKLAALEPSLTAEFNQDSQAQRLVTIPGFGTLTALLVSAECGAILRFDSQKQLTAYVGLVPSTHSSGGNIRHGKLTKTGNPYVRWALTQAAYRAVRKDPYLKHQYETLSGRIGKRKAIMAIARKLLVSAYYMVTRSANYQWRQIPRVETGSIPRTHCESLTEVKS